MGESLLSVGLDVGTTTTQLIVSRLQIENRASVFTVPRLEIAGREILYRSQVVFTPLLGQDLVDGEAIAEFVRWQYGLAGIKQEQVDTGAVIITGETSRKENARAVLDALSSFAGDFVVATAGPELESVLAAKGAGAVEYSRQTGKRVLHMDIGGGTSNLALIEKGEILATGCLNVGGRLVKLERGRVCYISPVVADLTSLKVGDIPQPGQLEALAQLLTQALEMAAGLTPATPLLQKLTTREVGQPWPVPTPGAVISFSGGVADCIDETRTPGAFGDMGGELGQAIKKSKLCEQEYRLGSHTIRATVIGAGCHSAQLSGSTVYCRGVQLPLKNLPVASLSEPVTPEGIARSIHQTDCKTPVLALEGNASGYKDLCRLAQVIAESRRNQPVYLCLEKDMAKALGQRLSLILPPETPILCLDGVQPGQASFLDVGRPVGSAFPVVVKTLVLEQQK